MSLPQVVVVVLNWNGREDTLACLASLGRCTYPNHQVLVVDNGSADGSEQAIRAAYPQLPLLQTGANLGFAGGNNTGIDWALRHRADWVLLLNNDTEVEPEFLTELVERAQRDSRVGVVGAAIAYARRPQQLWAYGGGRFNVATGRVRHVQQPVPDDALSTHGAVHFYVTGCAMLLRRQLLQQVGVLDTRYFHFCEDADLCLRAETAGWQIAVAPRARMIHKVSATTRVSSPTFLYYNLRSRLTLVDRFGPKGSPSARAIAVLWLRLWRPALLSGMGAGGWRALRRALRDYRAGVQGPAPADLSAARRARAARAPGAPGAPGTTVAALLAGAITVGMLLATGVGTLGMWGCGRRSGQSTPAGTPAAGAATDGAAGSARAQPGDVLADHLSALWGDAADAPRQLELLLWRMAQDPGRANQVVTRADTTHRALTDTLLSVLRWGEPRARRVLPDLYVIHDFGPPPGQRPPTWADLRRQGLRLLPRIALDPRREGDALLQRQLDPLPPGERRSPSVIGGQVQLWETWWATRGLDPRFYLNPTRIPDPAPWLALLRGETPSPTRDRRAPRGGDQGRAARALQTPLGLLVRPLADDALHRAAVVAALGQERDQFLVAEAMALLPLYQEEFVAAGVPARGWDPQLGEPIGYRGDELRAVALDILDRTAGHFASGATQDEVVLDWLRWWSRARFEARFYRDPRQAPEVSSLLGGLGRVSAEGGGPLAPFLREAFLAAGYRDLLLARWVADGGRANVAELIEWLQRDRSSAVATGFDLFWRLTALRPLPGDAGQPSQIPWEGVQAMVRDMLRQATGDEAPPDNGTAPAEIDAAWAQWWDAHRAQPRWYRHGAQPQPGRFTPERGRSD